MQKDLFIAILITAAVLLSGCIDSGPSVGSGDLSEAKCDDPEYYAAVKEAVNLATQFCYQDKSKEDCDKEAAESTDPAMLKAGCYGELANERNDPTICEKLAEQKFKNYCYNTLIYSSGDPKICDKITNLEARDGCYSINALGGNAELCGKISDSEKKSACMQTLTYMQR